jgi:WD40 repeat protein
VFAISAITKAATGRFLAMLEEETTPIAAVAFSPDGQSLAARAAAGRIRVWRIDRIQSGDRIGILASPLWDTTSLGSSAGTPATAGPTFVAGGRLIAFGTGDGTILVRDTADGRLERTLGPESVNVAVTVLAVDRDGQRLASGDADGAIRLWDLSTQSPPTPTPTRLATAQEVIRALALAGNRLAVPGRSLDLWDIDRSERLLTIDTDARAINCLDLSADGRILATGDDRKVTRRDLEQLRQLLAEIELGW